MRAARIDFARPIRRTRWIGLLIAALAGLALAWSARDVLELARMRDDLAARLAASPGARVSATQKSVPAEDKATQDEIERARRVLQRLGIPWHELFRAIEGAIVPGVALVAVQPSASNRQIRIAGDAADLGAAVRFVERLAAGKRLANVHLIQHERRAAGGAIGFTAMAEWSVSR